MKQAAAGIAMVGSIATIAYYQGGSEQTNLFEISDVARVEFDKHIAEYGKSYGTKEEYEFRLKIFSDNLIKISEHNQRNADDAIWGINFMADWTKDEYRRLLGFKGQRESGNHGQAQQRNLSLSDLPASIDWREKGAVTPVKNQGGCGSCWAFSSTGAMEGAYFLQKGKLESFSEQQLVDCSMAEGNQGCMGGWMDQAFTYAEKSKMDTEAQYPYKGRTGSSCEAKDGVAKVTGFTDIAQKDPVALAEALQNGPVSIALDASGLSWQFYWSGIIKHFCGTSLDHGVLLVGYGTQRGEDYWIVKNSWGAHWGEKGYVRIFRDMTQQGPGTCGLQLKPSQPKF